MDSGESDDQPGGKGIDPAGWAACGNVPPPFALHSAASFPYNPPAPRPTDGRRGVPIWPGEDRMSFDHRAATSPVRRLLLALVAAVCRRPRLVLLVALGLALVSGVAAATRLQYHTSRNDL